MSSPSTSGPGLATDGERPLSADFLKMWGTEFTGPMPETIGNLSGQEVFLEP